MAVPFAPPLGVELNYNLRNRKVSAGKTITSAVDFFIRFDRSGSGYTLTVRSVLLGLDAAQRRDPAVSVLEAPVAFILDLDGAIVSIDKEDEYWRRVEAVVARMPNTSAVDTASITRTLKGMRDLPSAQRTELAGRNIRPIIELAGAEMTIGEKRTVAAETVTLPLPVPDPPRIQRDTLLTLEQADGTSATFVVETRYDREGLRAFNRNLARLGPAAKRQSVTDEDLTGMTDKATYIVLRSSGLTRSYRRTIGAEGAAGSATETTSLELRTASLPRGAREIQPVTEMVTRPVSRPAPVTDGEVQAFLVAARRGGAEALETMLGGRILRPKPPREFERSTVGAFLESLSGCEFKAITRYPGDPDVFVEWICPTRRWDGNPSEIAGVIVRFWRTREGLALSYSQTGVRRPEKVRSAPPLH